MSAENTVEAQAALWLLRREEPDWSAAEQRALDNWLESSASHQAAYWRLEHGWSLVGASVTAPDHGILFKEEPVPQRRRWLPVALAASLVAVVATMTQVADWSIPGERPIVAERQFDTARGERKIATLAEGSKIELNTATSLRAAIGQGHREVWLDRGEAYFSIARRDGQHFIVHAGDRTITVLGTKFNVRRDGGRVMLSVVEGRVALADKTNGATGRAIVVTGGDMAVAEGASTVVTADMGDKVAEAVAWRDGILTFDHSTLAEVAAEFNRYNEKALMVTDADAARIRIGGSFKWNNVDAFARLMREAYGLHVTDDGETIKISSR